MATLPLTPSQLRCKWHRFGSGTLRRRSLGSVPRVAGKVQRPWPSMTAAMVQANTVLEVREALQTAESAMNRPSS